MGLVKPLTFINTNCIHILLEDMLWNKIQLSSLCYDSDADVFLNKTCWILDTDLGVRVHNALNFEVLLQVID